MGRAQRTAEIAEDFASAGRWGEAFTAIRETEQVPAAIDDLNKGDSRRAEEWLKLLPPTPETVGKSLPQLEIDGWTCDRETGEWTAP